MALPVMPIPDDLLVLGHGGTTAELNRAGHPEFNLVTGEPSFPAEKPDRRAAEREAFAALHVVKRCAPSGAAQQVFLGEAAIHLAYGRAKKQGEPDCDVIGYLLRHGSYGFFLAEGKGTDVQKATRQFAAIVPKLAALKPAQNDPNAPRPAGVIGGLIVTNSLRYLQWNQGRRQWVAYLNAEEDREMTRRLQPNIVRADPTLQQDKVYLADGPEDARDQLPLWALSLGTQPFTVWEHNRRPRTRGSFQPALIGGAGTLELFYVMQ